MFQTTTESAVDMTPFRRIERDPVRDMQTRQLLLSRPDEAFQPFFEGRTPTPAEKVRFVDEEFERVSSMHVFENNLYRVEVTYHAPFIHLCIARLDGAQCKVWRHLQQIKNAIVGSECEGVELFPSEGRRVEASTEYHLWVHANPGYRFPFGFSQRFVLDKPVIGTRLASPMAAADGVSPRMGQAA